MYVYSNFFFQAEDGIRDADVTGVQTCALPISAWLRSPLARKIVALAIASSEPGTEQKVAAYAATIKTNPPTDRRVALLQRLDCATAATEISSDLVAAASRAIPFAVSAAAPAVHKLL